MARKTLLIVTLAALSGPLALGDSTSQAVPPPRGVKKKAKKKTKKKARKRKRPAVKIHLPAVTRYHVPVGKSPVKGRSTALVTIVSFWDFQCPFCSRAMSTMMQLLKLYPKDVRLVFKHNPLRFHRYAHTAAQAAVEAHKQKKFWKYQALLWPNARSLTQAKLEQLAKTAKMNVRKLKLALSKGKHRNTVNSDIALARQLGATGTPAFFINGVKMRGARPLSAFKAEVERQIKYAKKLLKSKKGLKRKKLYAEIIKGGLKRAPFRRRYYRWRRRYRYRRRHYRYALAKVYTQSSHIKPSRKLTLKDAPQIGPKRAPVTLIFFGGFRCYYAQRLLSAFQELSEEYPGMLRLVFKHHVLRNHQYGYLAAQAAVEAQKQGRFWEYARHLWANRYNLSRAKLLLIAKNIGLDTNKLSRALTDERHALRVQRDFAEARGHLSRTYMCEAVLLPGGQNVGGYYSINNLRQYVLPIIKEMNFMGHILPLP